MNKPIPLTTFRETTGEDTEPFFQTRDEINAQRRKTTPAHAKGRKAVLYCALAAGVVLVINIIVALIASSSPAFKPYLNELPSINAGDCQVTGRWSLGVHVLINGFSTILLGCSNYCMQRLSACTREEADRAHQKGSWVHVGSMSLRNLRFVPKIRMLLWLLLAISSVPLHLMYNSVVTEYLGINLVNQVTISPDLLFSNRTVASMQRVVNLNLDQYGTLDKFVNGTAASFTRISREDCVSRYSQASELGAENAHGPHAVTYLPTSGGDVAAVILSASGQIQNSFSILNNQLGVNESAIPFLYNRTQTNSWFCGDQAQCSPITNPYDNNWSQKILGNKCVFPDCTTVAKSDPSQWLFEGHQIDYCLVENVPNQCRMQVNITVLWAVIACNAVKVVCMLIVALNMRSQGMVTIGDAIASYTAHPDPVTSSKCLLSSKELTSGNKRVKGMYQAPAMQHMHNTQHDIRFWDGRSEPWRRAAGRTDWLLCIVLSLVVLLGTGVIMAMGADQGLAWNTDWTPVGAINRQHVVHIFDGSDDKTAIAPLIIIANIPQLVISTLYLLYNQVLTMMLAASEWKLFGRTRAGLRVSFPVGSQRSTYFLSIPYGYGIPLMVSMFLLHWGLSQSLFLVQLQVYRSGDIAPDSSAYAQTRLFWNPAAMYFCIALGIIMLVALLGLGIFRHYPQGPPLRASNSLIISAACHPPIDDDGAETRPISWGVVGVDWAQNYHCAFSSRAAGLPPVGARCQ